MPDRIDEQLERVLATTANTFRPSATSGPEAATVLLERLRRRRHRRRLTGVGGVLIISALAVLGLVAGWPDHGSRAQQVSTLGRGDSSATATTTTTLVPAPSGAAVTRPDQVSTTAPCLLQRCGIRPSPTTSAPSGSPHGPPPTGATSTTTTRPTTTTTGPLSSGLITVSDAGSGSTVNLGIGQSLRIQLSGSSAAPWTNLAASDYHILQGQPAGMVPTQGSVVVQYRGAAIGQASVTATQDPTCRRTTPPCGTPSRLFTLTVNVVAG